MKQVRGSGGGAIFSLGATQKNSKQKILLRLGPHNHGAAGLEIVVDFYTETHYLENRVHLGDSFIWFSKEPVAS